MSGMGLQEGAEMNLEMTKAFAKALSQDIFRNPRLSAALDYLVREAPASEAATLVQAVMRDLMNEFEDSPAPAKFPRTRMLFRQMFGEESTGMGQDWGELLAGAITSITDAVTSIYVTKAKVESQEKIAELQAAMKAREAEAVQAQAEAKAKEAEAIIKAASLPGVWTEPTTQGAATPATPIQASTEIPGWLIPAGIGAGLLVLFLALR